MKSSKREEQYLDGSRVIGLSGDTPVTAALLGLIERATGVTRINAIMRDIGPPWPDANTMIDQLFERLNIRWEIENPEMLEQLDGRPKVFVANHPYGLPDAFALFQLLTRYRPNLKLFANKLLAATRLEDERLLYVDPFMSPDSRAQNRKSITEALQHLRSGGDLALFPGRICSHLKTSDWTISDSDWSDQTRRFVEAAKGDMVPLYISGRNSMLFNLSGLIHPRIRTYMLLNEFLRGGHDFRFKVGEPVSADQLRRVSRSLSAGSFARSLTYALKTGAPEVPALPHLINPELRLHEEQLAVRTNAVPIGGKAVFDLLKEHEAIVQQNGNTIFSISGGVSKQLLDVICEVRFRAYASETTLTDPRDFEDSFDQHYNHLILWDDVQETVIGVYRYCLPGQFGENLKENQLVTGSIFKLQPEFRALLPNSMELGRAAILPEYQRSYSPLMLLWRGILEIPKRDTDIRYLFGPVTMGRTFNPVSRELLQRFIMRRFGDEKMDGFVKPKRRLKLAIPREVDIEGLDNACNSFAELGHIVNGFEGGKRSLPVLFRHYANVGCRYIGFGEWKELDHATAGLTVLDLRNISRSLINRYYGVEGADAFLAGR